MTTELTKVAHYGPAVPCEYPHCQTTSSSCAGPCSHLTQRPAAQTEREAFEAWLRTKPEARLWNTTDAMLAAYQAGRASLPAPQQATPEPDDDDDDKWRDVALRFDKHRMQALWHLNAMLQDPVKHADIVRQFLKDPTHPAAATPEPVGDAYHVKLLIEAIGTAAQKAGIYNGQVPLTGPLALMLVDDMATCAATRTAPVETEPVGERWVVVRETALDVGRGNDVRTGGRPELGYALVSDAATFGSEGEAVAAIESANLPVGWVVLPLSRLLPDLEYTRPAPGVPEVEPNEMESKWCWWLGDGERFHIADTESEAHGEAQCRIDDDCDPGQTHQYSVARVQHPLDSLGMDWLALHVAQSIAENVCCWCDDNTGAEEPSIMLSPDDSKALGVMVATFLRQRVGVDWWTADQKTVTVHTYVSGSNDNHALAPAQAKGADK